MENITRKKKTIEQIKREAYKKDIKSLFSVYPELSGKLFRSTAYIKVSNGGEVSEEDVVIIKKILEEILHQGVYTTFLNLSKFISNQDEDWVAILLSTMPIHDTKEKNHVNGLFIGILVIFTILVILIYTM